MDFFLVSILNTSSNISNISLEINNFFIQAEKTFLCKGAPYNKGAKIENLSIHENEIHLSIRSNKYVRAHDALLRIKKNLSFFLGSQFKIGIRNIQIKYFEIIIPSSTNLTNKTLPYVKEINFKNNNLHILLNVGEKEIKNQVPDRILNLIDDKLKQQNYGSKSEHWNLLWESDDRDFKYFNDPTEDMIHQGWIKRGCSRGQWIYGSQSTQLFRTFEKIVEEKLLSVLHFNEMIFPKLITWDVWKHSGHANGIYPEIYYVCAPKTRDPKYWEEVSDYYKITHEVPIELITKKITAPIGGLCYAQCPSCWTFFQGKTISNESVPIKIFDRSGTSHRYESGGIHGIERVDEFHRIEIVWIGKKEHVTLIANELHNIYTTIFNDILELKWRKAWVTPWFMAQEGLVDLSTENKVGTTDYEAQLPYRGKNNEWLEFQNLSINGDKYPKGFNVKLQNEDQLWSGCSGIGLERWASVFLAQHGLDIKNWPEKFIYYFGEEPQSIKFL